MSPRCVIRGWPSRAAALLAVLVIAVAGRGALLSLPGGGGGSPGGGRGPLATGPSATPPVWTLESAGWPGALAADDKGAVAVFGNHEVLGVDPDDGEVRWRTEISSRVFPHPPALDDGVVAVLLDDGFEVLDRETGERLWREESLGLPGAVQAAGGIVATATYDGSLSVHDAWTGERRWARVGPGAAAARPALDAGAGVVVEVFEMGPGRGAMLTAFDLADGVQRWTTQLDGGASAPLVASGTVVVGDGDRHIKGFDLASGAPRWSVPSRGAFESDLELAELSGKVVAVDRLAGVTSIDVESGRVDWQVDLDDAVIALRPALAAEPQLVAVTTSGGRRVVVLDGRDGRVVLDRRPQAVPQGVAWHPRRPGLLLVGLRFADPGRVEAWRVGR